MSFIADEPGTSGGAPHWSQRLAGALRATPGLWPLPGPLHDLVFLRPAAYWPFLRGKLRDPASYRGAAGDGLRVLVINHYFDLDIDALLAANQSHRFLILRYQELRELARMHFPRRVLSGFRAYNEPALAANRLRYRRSLRRAVDEIRARFPFDVVVTPSDAFFWIREFVPEVQSRGAPVIVLDKEGMISPHFFSAHAAELRAECPFISDALLVWSRRQRDFWIAAGAPPHAIHVVGQPRSDYWHQPQRWKAKRELGLALREGARLALFFSFERSAYIPAEIYARGAVRWDLLFEQSHRVVYAAAAANPAWDFVVKAHPQQDRVSALRSDVAAQRLPNLHLAEGPALGNPLLAHADVVAGFQTTALYEAMLARERPVIYTFWSDARRWAEEILPLHRCAGLTVARSALDFRVALERALRDPRATPEQLAARPAWLQSAFHQPDGQASARALAQIEQIVAAHRGRCVAGRQRAQPATSEEAVP